MNAKTIVDVFASGTPPEIIEEERFCKKCRQPLSMYNKNEYCFVHLYGGLVNDIEEQYNRFREAQNRYNKKRNAWRRKK